MTDDALLLPMRVDDPWLVKLAEGWNLPFLGLLLPHGALMVVWLWRDA